MKKSQFILVVVSLIALFVWNPSFAQRQICGSVMISPDSVYVPGPIVRLYHHQVCIDSVICGNSGTFEFESQIVDHLRLEIHFNGYDTTTIYLPDSLDALTNLGTVIYYSSLPPSIICYHLVCPSIKEMLKHFDISSGNTRTFEPEEVKTLVDPANINETVRTLSTEFQIISP
jgi:hypothetical protein